MPGGGMVRRHRMMGGSDEAFSPWATTEPHRLKRGTSQDVPNAGSALAVFSGSIARQIGEIESFPT
jgi:hypothetical protein